VDWGLGWDAECNGGLGLGMGWAEDLDCKLSMCWNWGLDCGLGRCVGLFFLKLREEGNSQNRNFSTIILSMDSPSLLLNPNIIMGITTNITIQAAPTMLMPSNPVAI